MKKILSILGSACLVLLLSFPSLAASFQVDASYLVGFSTEGFNFDQRGFAVNAKAGIITDFLADVTFLSVAKGPKTEKLINAGALCRVLSDYDLKVYVGGGYLGLTTETANSNIKGRGAYGKMSFQFLPAPYFVVGGDLAYVPLYKTNDQKGNLLSARGTIAYQVYPGLSLQAVVERYKVYEALPTSNTLLGIGAAVRF